MKVELSITGDRMPDAFESLVDWLRGEPQLSGRVELVREAPTYGEMGAVLDTLTVAVGAGGGLTVLASALQAWLSQPRHSQIRVTVRGDGGDKVVIDADRVRPEEVVTLLRHALGADSSDSQHPD
jgi:hypothetical protein